MTNKLIKEKLNIPIIVIDKFTYTILDANKQCLDFLEIYKSKILFSKFTDIFFEDNKKEILKYLSTIDLSKNIDTEIQIFDDEKFSVRLLAELETIVDKELIKIFLIPNHEKTILKKELAKKNKISKEIAKNLDYEKILKNLSDIFFQTNLDGKILQIYGNIREILGYNKDDLINKNIDKIFSNARDRIPYLMRIINTGKIEDFEITIETKNSKKKVCSFNSYLVEGEKKIIEGTMRDITKRKIYENNLKRSHKTLHTFVLNFKEIIITLDKKYIIKEINRAVYKTLGFKQLELINKPLENLISKENVENIDSKLKENRFVRDEKFIIESKNGETKHFLFTALAFRSKKTNNLVKTIGILKDITVQYLNEQRLHKISDELMFTNEIIKETQSHLVMTEKLASIGNLAAGVAHEINNPIGFISGNFDSLKDYFTIILESLKFQKKYIKDDEQITKKIENFEKEKDLEFILEDIDELFSETDDGIKRVINIVQNLRNFSRVDSVANFEHINLNESIDNTLVVARNEYKYNSIIEKKFGDIPLVLCSGTQLNQVFLNIIINASHAIKKKYSGKEGVISIKTFKEKEYVICEIKDNGTGISDSVINKIFDPFFTTKPPGSGTGLGLNISYDIIVNKHNGDLLVESDGKSFTKFIIKLPIKKGEQND